jgi:excisionase family DNA binding protein
MTLICEEGSYRKRDRRIMRARLVNGALLDVRHAAQFLGVTEKTLRARVARRVVPFKRLGGRVVFVKADLEAFLSSLDGCTTHEALDNMRARRP